MLEEGGKGCGCCIRRDVRGSGWGEEVRGREEKIHEKKCSFTIHKEVFAPHFVSYSK